MTTTIERMKQIDNRQAEIERDARINNAGQFSDAQRAEYERLDGEYARLKSTQNSRRTLPTAMAPLNSIGDDDMADDDDPQFRQRMQRVTGSQIEWHNLSDGTPVNVYSPSARLSTSPTGSFGKYLRGISTGNWKGADREKAMALSEGGTGGGHVLVPDELSSVWIDAARAKSVLVRAGMQTVDMNSETMTLARVDDDPTFSVVGENQTISATDIEIGSVQLVSRKVGCIVTASRELLQDAPNAPTMIEQVMARALAVEIDRLGLIGDGGTDGVYGLVKHTDVGLTGSVGAILWEDFITAVTGVRENNYEPTAIVVHPTIHSDAMAITSGDGVASAKLWLNAPPHVANVPFLDTTAITTAYAVAGDFSNLLMGIRTGATLETTTVSDTAFEKHQVKFKIVQRLAFAVTRAAAFHVLSGITT